jgi:uncharacterized delta-60 repeat protein
VTAGQAAVGGVDVILATRMTTSGALDPTFGTGGITTVKIGSGAGVDSGAGIALQPDGKIVIAGTGHGNGSPNFAAVRLNTDGSLDSTFGSDGVVTVPIGGAAIANAVVVQPDGRIVLGGTAYTTDTNSNHFAATRLNANGSLDSTFGTNGVTVLAPTGGAWGMVRQTDGRIVLAGQRTYNGTEAYMAARLLATGKLDTAYGQGGIVTVPIGSKAIATAIALQRDGKTVISGEATTDRGVVATVRLTSGGSLDASYGSGGISQFTGAGVNTMTIDSAGRVLVAGVGVGMVRLKTTGGLDTTFASGGVGFYSAGTSTAANGMALQADGRIVLAGAVLTGGQMKVLVMRVWP